MPPPLIFPCLAGLHTPLFSIRAPRAQRTIRRGRRRAGRRVRPFICQQTAKAARTAAERERRKRHLIKAVNGLAQVVLMMA